MVFMTKSVIFTHFCAFSELGAKSGLIARSKLIQTTFEEVNSGYL